MPSVDSNGVAIHYEVQGDGPPVVLLHGFTSSGALWQYYGYVEALRARYRVVTIDARGHGRSGKPHEPAAYALPQRLDDVEAALNALGIGRAHVVGYSMGGWMALGMAAQRPQRVASLAVGGAHLYEEDFSPFAGVDGSDGQVFMAALERFLGERIAPATRMVMLRNDLRALAAALTPRDPINPADIQVPRLLFCGAEDQRLASVRRAAAELHCAPPLVIPEANHTTALSFSNAVLPALLAFLDEQPAA
jgi:pimeloyl-ACP methyl ester carboxylesterase